VIYLQTLTAQIYEHDDINTSIITQIQLSLNKVEPLQKFEDVKMIRLVCVKSEYCHIPINRTTSS